MGQAVIGYGVLMIELFILLTATAGMETALWTLGLVHVGCALGTCVCVWSERGTHKIARMERG